MAYGGYERTFYQNFELTDSWTQYTHEFTAAADVDDLQVKLWYLNEGVTYYIDNVLVVHQDSSGLGLVKGADSSDLILGLYPNPAITVLEVELASSGNYTFQVWDINGSIKMNTSIKDSNKKSINVESLTPGVYFLRVRSELSHLEGNYKFLKQ